MHVNAPHPSNTSLCLITRLFICYDAILVCIRTRLSGALLGFLCGRRSFADILSRASLPPRSSSGLCSLLWLVLFLTCVPQLAQISWLSSLGEQHSKGDPQRHFWFSAIYFVGYVGVLNPPRHENSGKVVGRINSCRRRAVHPERIFAFQVVHDFLIVTLGAGASAVVQQIISLITQLPLHLSCHNKDRSKIRGPLMETIWGIKGGSSLMRDFCLTFVDVGRRKECRASPYERFSQALGISMCYARFSTLA